MGYVSRQVPVWLPTPTTPRGLQPSELPVRKDEAREASEEAEVSEQPDLLAASKKLCGREADDEGNCYLSMRLDDAEAVVAAIEATEKRYAECLSDHCWSRKKTAARYCQQCGMPLEKLKEGVG